MDEAWVERECLLFEAGRYPDRGVDVSEADLVAIAANSPGEVPVRVEHLAESPFDSALGVVTRLRASGGKLWGTLRQPVETWRFVQRAGAKALSVAVDFGRRRLAEVSFVTRPRVAAAQVFSSVQPQNIVDCRLSIVGHEGCLPVVEQGFRLEEVGEMVSVRQFAEGLMGYLKGVVEEGTVQVGRQELAQERELFHQEQVETTLLDLKRRGLLRASDAAYDSARALLSVQDTNVTQFGNDAMPIRRLFHRFLEANGPVWPAGEVAPGLAGEGSGSTERLIAMAKGRAARDGMGYVAAFNEVSKENPALAAAVRAEGL